ncbi:MAG: glycosyltransferase [Oscillospiraceae bacterium]|nr:glycosyltransferase [Oscillospiraceae bacterium]
MIQNKDKISIIVPVYNVEKYFDKCINSILNQTYLNVEVILINDGSSDGSGQLCDKYKEQDNRIKVMHQDNQGQAIARNNGLDIATGNYIGFVDSDDWIEDDMYELLYKNIINYTADISMCKYTPIEEDQLYTPNLSFENRIVVLEGNDIIKHNLLKYDDENRINDGVCNKLYKRYLFDEIRFPPNKIYEDIMATYQLIQKAKKFVLSSDYKYIYSA